MADLWQGCARSGLGDVLCGCLRVGEGCSTARVDAAWLEVGVSHAGGARRTPGLALVHRVATAERRLNRLAVVGKVKIRLCRVQVFAGQRARAAPGIAADLVVEARLAEAADAAVLAVAKAGLRVGLRVRVGGTASVASIQRLVVRGTRRRVDHSAVTGDEERGRKQKRVVQHGSRPGCACVRVRR
eukprot:7376556-Prymnesium_polylepis.1